MKCHFGVLLPLDVGVLNIREKEQETSNLDPLTWDQLHSTNPTLKFRLFLSYENSIGWYKQVVLGQIPSLTCLSRNLLWSPLHWFPSKQFSTRDTRHSYGIGPVEERGGSWIVNIDRRRDIRPGIRSMVLHYVHPISLPEMFCRLTN